VAESVRLDGADEAGSLGIRRGDDSAVVVFGIAVSPSLATVFSNGETSFGSVENDSCIAGFHVHDGLAARELQQWKQTYGGVPALSRVRHGITGKPGRWPAGTSVQALWGNPVKIPFPTPLGSTPRSTSITDQCPECVAEYERIGFHSTVWDFWPPNHPARASDLGRWGPCPDGRRSPSLPRPVRSTLCKGRKMLLAVTLCLLALLLLATVRLLTSAPGQHTHAGEGAFTIWQLRTDIEVERRHAESYGRHALRS
jgi:hypothetical protein